MYLEKNCTMQLNDTVMSNIYFIAEEIIDSENLSVERFYDYDGFVIRSTFEIYGNIIICLN